MCLLVVAWRRHPRHRLVVAANRDEYHERPAAPLAPWTDQPGVVGGMGSLERRLRALVAPATLSRTLRYVLPVIALVLLLIILVAPHPVLGAH